MNTTNTITQNINLVNPLTIVRRENRWTMKKAARLLHVAESTFRRTEEGMYNEIPPVLISNLAPYITSPVSLRNEYSRYQTSKRASVLEQRQGTIGLSQPGLNNSPWDYFITEHMITQPFTAWMKLNGWESRLDFCRDLCVHPSTVSRYEKSKPVNMPLQLQLALEEVNVDTERIHRQYTIWRNAERAARSKNR